MSAADLRADEARWQRLIEAARARGRGLYPIAPYYLRPPPQQGLLLGYAGSAPRAIDAAMCRFGQALRTV